MRYLLKKVVKLRFAAQDNRNSDKCAVFQQCCEFLIFLSSRVCYIAWHSSFWCRLLPFANRDLQFATERHAWQNFDDKGDDSPDTEASEQQEDTEDCSPDILFTTRKRGGIFSQSALAEGNTVGRRIYLWLRLMTFHSECVNHYKSAVLNGYNIPRLSFSVIRTPRPQDGQQLHYRVLLRSLTNDADAIPAIEHYLTKEGKALLATSHTRGNYHAEALMSSFLFAASGSAPGDGIVHDGIPDVLDSLRGAKPVIVASKRCCPVCQTIIHYLGEHNDQQIPILDAHNIRAAQTGVFDLDIRISNRLFIDVCTSCVVRTGLNSRNVEKE